MTNMVMLVMYAFNISLGVTIGFERTMYNVTEGVDASVELCAVLTSGILEREAVVAFSTSDGTATSGGLCVHCSPYEELV